MQAREQKGSYDCAAMFPRNLEQMNRYYTQGKHKRLGENGKPVMVVDQQTQWGSHTPEPIATSYEEVLGGARWTIDRCGVANRIARSTSIIFLLFLFISRISPFPPYC